MSRTVGAKPIVVTTGSGASVETVYFTYRPTIDIATKRERLVVLNALSSRSNAGAITRSASQPWTVTGTDSLSGETYTYTHGKSNINQYPRSGAYLSESYETAKAGVTATGSTYTVTPNVTYNSRSTIKLTSGNNCTSSFVNNYLGRSTYCSVFGPEVYSEPFYAVAGQALSFNWIAVEGSDHYEVYAFLVAVDDDSLTTTPADNRHTLLAHGMGAVESDWVSSSGNIPADGLYRFRFVNGSYDYSGGKALGANMYVDQNITVGNANAITFAPVGDQIGATGTFTQSLTSTSGDAVTVTTSTSSVCTTATSHSGTTTTLTITKVSAGTCVLTATQGASGIFAPAAQVSRAFEIRASAIEPTAPTITSIVGENGALRVNFNLPERDGGAPITNYKYRIGSGSWVELSPSTTSSPITISGLTNGTSYSITLRAVNSVGDGTISNAVSGTPQASAPGAPTISAITASDQTLSVAFTPPANDGGSSISNYEYSLDGGSWVTPSPAVSSSPLEITGLTNGTAYSVRIRAVNSTGSGTASNSVSATPTDVVVTPPAPQTPAVIATPTPTVTPRPIPTRRPQPSAPRPTAGPVITPSPSISEPPNPTPTPSITPTPVPTLKLIPVAIPEREPTPNVVYTSSNPIPEELVEALFSPLAYVSEQTSTPSLPTLTPAQSLAFENGAAVEVQLVVTSNQNGYLLQGENWLVALEATDTQGTPLVLDDSGNLVLNSDRFVQFQGTGFAPGSIIKVWLFSDPRSLADVTADANGNFTGRAQLPTNIPDGEHTVQLNGLSKDGQVRSVALGVVVQPEATISPSAQLTDFSALWELAVLLAGAALIALFGFILIRALNPAEALRRFAISRSERALAAKVSEINPSQQLPVDSRRRLGRGAPPNKKRGTWSRERRG